VAFFRTALLAVVSLTFAGTIRLVATGVMTLTNSSPVGGQLIAAGRPPPCLCPCWLNSDRLLPPFNDLAAQVRDLANSGYPNHEWLAEIKKTGRFHPVPSIRA
jgi:hypothetical protein